MNYPFDLPQKWPDSKTIKCKIWNPKLPKMLTKISPKKNWER